MSVLESLRQRSGLLVAVVGIALLTFVLTGLFDRTSSFGGNDNIVGEIAGKSIEYPAFNAKVQEAIENRKQASGKNVLTDKETDDVVSEVWNRMINEEVMEKEYQKIGISVSDDELYDMMVEHPHPYFLRYLSDPNTGKINPAFTDPNTGQVSPAKLRDFTQNMAPEQEVQWVQLEDLMRQIRIIEKYNSLVKKGMYVTNYEAKRLFEDQNNKANIKFTLKAYQALFDNKVEYKDEDVEKYYTAHKGEYKQDASRNIEYVVFDIVPSEEDKAVTLKDMEKVTEKLKEEKSFSDDSILVVSESDSREFDMSYHTKGTLSSSIDSLMFEEKPGFVKGPFEENGMIKSVKLIKTKTSADSAKLRHILISYRGAGASPNITRTKEQAKVLADSLLELLKPKGKKGKRSKESESFKDLVAKYSDDGGKNKPSDKKEDEDYLGKDGNYGWVNETSQFVPEFKDAGLDGNEGDITIAETQFGYHIIEILDSKGSQKKVQIATIERKLEPSNKTMQAIFSRAAEFAGKNNTLELFRQAVIDQKMNKRIAVKIKENDRIIPGIESSKSIIRWMYETEKGVVSEPKDIGGKFIVAVVSDVREKGYATLEQVKDEVTEAVIKEKKAQLFVTEFNEALKSSSSVEQIASKVGSVALSASDVTFSLNSLNGLGNELAVIGVATSLKEKTMSKPIIGKTGVSVCYIEAKTVMPAPKDYNAQKSQELSKLQMRVDFEEVFKALKENANVQEHLVKFY